MQSLLLIDTASPDCGVYLSCKGELRQQVAFGEQKAAQRVLQMLESLLADVDIGLSHLHGIGVINGPGSFTGMRIGVAVAQALAYTNQLPVVPISTLAALACSAAAQEAPDSWLVTIPARDNEFYFGAYQSGENGLITSLVPDQVVSMEAETAFKELEQEAEWGLVGQAGPEEGVLTALGVRSRSNIVVSKPDQAMYPEALFALLASELSKLAGNGSGLPLPNYVKDQMEYSK